MYFKYICEMHLNFRWKYKIHLIPSISLTQNTKWNSFETHFNLAWTFRTCIIKTGQSKAYSTVYTDAVTELHAAQWTSWLWATKEFQTLYQTRDNDCYWVSFCQAGKSFNGCWRRYSRVISEKHSFDVWISMQHAELSIIAFQEMCMFHLVGKNK